MRLVRLQGRGRGGTYGGEGTINNVRFLTDVENKCRDTKGGKWGGGDKLGDWD